jgi:hypothetical protein
MSNVELIEKINAVIENYDIYSLRELRNALYPLISDIQTSVPRDIFDDFATNYDCVKYEMLYGGDEEDEKLVKDECKEAIDAVLEHLKIT